MADLETLSEHACFGGLQGWYRHASETIGLPMRFGVFLPPQAIAGARGRTDVPRIVDWYMERKINIDDLITHRLKLEDINTGFELMKKGESIRSVVVF